MSSESAFVNPICKSNTVSLGTQLIQSAVVLHCNRFIILSIQVIHKKQRQKINIFNLAVQYLRSTVSECEFAQSCLTLCDPMDCSLPDSSIHGILQARILEWVVISFSSTVVQ